MPGIGRIAPILDPEKSIFVAFAPDRGGAAPPYEPGRFGWERLRTADVAAAAEFYAATFGWQVTVGEGGGVVDVDGLRVAELVPDAATRLAAVRAGRAPRRGLPPHRRARRRGRGAGALAGTAGYALVRDPQGVAFAVHAE